MASDNQLCFTLPLVGLLVMMRLISGIPIEPSVAPVAEDEEVKDLTLTAAESDPTFTDPMTEVVTFVSYSEEPNSLSSTSAGGDSNCNALTATNDSPQTLQNAISKSPVLMFITLDFVDTDFESETAYLNDTPSVIHPLTWICASEGKGYFLRTLKSNFIVLSLGTLSPNVSYVYLAVEVNNCSSFPYASDEMKLEMIANLILTSIDSACEGLDSQACGAEQQACQVFFAPPWNCHKLDFACSVLSWFVGAHTIALDENIKCWSPPHFQKIETISKVTQIPTFAASFGSTLLFFFAPLLLQLVLQKNPPIQETDGTLWLRGDSDLPVGLKYWLFIWKMGISTNEWKLGISGIRICFWILLVITISHFEIIVMYFHEPLYKVRRDSLFRYLLSKRVYYVLSYLHFFLFFIVCLTELYVIGTMSGEDQKDFYDKVQSKNTGLSNNSMLQAMKARLKIPFEPRSYAKDSPVSNKIFKFLGLFIGSLPLSYTIVIQWILLWAGGKASKCIAVLGTISIFITSYRIVFHFVQLVTFLIIYTYTGLLLNHANIDPTLLFSLAIIIFAIKETNGLYNKYFDLNILIISKACKACNIDENVSSSIQLDLFWYVVDRCQPVGLEVVASVRNFVISIGFFGIGFWILNQVNSLDKLSQVSNIVFYGSSLFFVLTKNIFQRTSGTKVEGFELELEVERLVKAYKRAYKKGHQRDALMKEQPLPELKSNEEPSPWLFVPAEPSDGDSHGDGDIDGDGSGSGAHEDIVAEDFV